MICVNCEGSGTVLRPRDRGGREQPVRDWFVSCWACWGSGVTANDFDFTQTKPLAHSRPYRCVNQIDWSGAVWSGATFTYSGCVQWDSRDGFELTL